MICGPCFDCDIHRNGGEDKEIGSWMFLFKRLDIVNEVKISKFEWAGVAPKPYFGQDFIALLYY